MKAQYYLYRNLDTGGFSIKYKGIVVDRLDFVLMSNVTFNVSTAGRLRAIEKKQRNVHAYIVSGDYMNGHHSWFDHSIDDRYEEITYNPFKHDSFVYSKSGEPIHHADEIIAVRGKVYVIKSRKEKNVKQH